MNEKRKATRRARAERRQSIRWEPSKNDRRRSTGRRKEDRVTDGIRTMYGPSADTVRYEALRAGRRRGK